MKSLGLRGASRLSRELPQTWSRLQVSLSRFWIVLVRVISDVVIIFERRMERRNKMQKPIILGPFEYHCTGELQDGRCCLMLCYLYRRPATVSTTNTERKDRCLSSHSVPSKQTAAKDLLYVIHS